MVGMDSLHIWLGLACGSSHFKFSVLRQFNQSINPSTNQFICDIAWDRAAPNIRVGGSCIKRMTIIHG